MAAVQETVERVRAIDVDAYKYGFVTDIESEKPPKGLDESTVRKSGIVASSRPLPARNDFTVPVHDSVFAIGMNVSVI